MTNHKISLRDRAQAEVLSAGSAFANRFPALGGLVGDASADSYTPLRWFHAGQTVASIRGWLEFAPDPDAGNVPRNYRQAAIIRVDRAAYAGYHDLHPGQQAVAYCLGKTAVMVGVRPDGADLFEVNPYDADNLAVAMRLGRGTLQAVAGIWTPASGLITGPDMLETGPVLPVAQVPSPIRVV